MPGSLPGAWAPAGTEHTLISGRASSRSAGRKGKSAMEGNRDEIRTKVQGAGGFEKEGSGPLGWGWGDQRRRGEYLNWTQILGGVWLANGRGGKVGGGSCLNEGREVGDVFGRQGACSATAFPISSHPFSNSRTLQGPDTVRSSPRRVTREGSGQWGCTKPCQLPCDWTGES